MWTENSSLQSTVIIDFFRILMVPGPGIEPGRPCGHEILSLERLPIPPSRHSTKIVCVEATIGVEPISKVLQTSA